MVSPLPQGHVYCCLGMFIDNVSRDLLQVMVVVVTNTTSNNSSLILQAVTVCVVLMPFFNKDALV